MQSFIFSFYICKSCSESRGDYKRKKEKVFLCTFTNFSKQRNGNPYSKLNEQNLKKFPKFCNMCGMLLFFFFPLLCPSLALLLYLVILLVAFYCRVVIDNSICEDATVIQVILWFDLVVDLAKLG